MSDSGLKMRLNALILLFLLSELQKYPGTTTLLNLVELNFSKFARKKMGRRVLMKFLLKHVFISVVSLTKKILIISCLVPEISQFFQNFHFSNAIRARSRANGSVTISAEKIQNLTKKSIAQTNRFIENLSYTNCR